MEEGDKKGLGRGLEAGDRFEKVRCLVTTSYSRTVKENLRAQENARPSVRKVAVGGKCVCGTEAGGNGGTVSFHGPLLHITEENGEKGSQGA